MQRSWRAGRFWASHAILIAPALKQAALLRGSAQALSDSARTFDLCDLLVPVSENLPQDFVRVFAKQRRAEDFARAVRELDRVANGQILAPGWMIDFDNRAGRAQR